VGQKLERIELIIFSFIFRFCVCQIRSPLYLMVQFALHTMGTTNLLVVLSGDQYIQSVLLGRKYHRVNSYHRHQRIHRQRKVDPVHQNQPHPSHYLIDPQRALGKAMEFFYFAALQI